MEINNAQINSFLHEDITCNYDEFDKIRETFYNSFMEYDGTYEMGHTLCDAREIIKVYHKETKELHKLLVAIKFEDRCEVTRINLV